MRCRPNTTATRWILAACLIASAACCLGTCLANQNQLATGVHTLSTTQTSAASVASSAAANTGTLATAPKADETTKESSWIPPGAPDNTEEVKSLLRLAESHRFGVSLKSASSATKALTSGASEVRARPSVHSYPHHASLQHSIRADKQIDIPAAHKLYHKAIALGSAAALNDLGEMYLVGEGLLLQNFTMAAVYFNHSANLGNAEAQHNLAILHYLGLNPTGQSDEALAMVNDYFAAMGDNPLAKMSLGYRHLYGINAPKSCEASVAYYQQVSEAVVMQSLLSPIHVVVEKARLSDERARSVPPEEDEDVLQYYQQAAENGDVNAQFALGQLHFYGARGYEQNPERAARYFKAAAAQGEAQAMSNLGQMYLQGLGVAQSNETALEYLTKAAEKGNPAAQNGLGYLHLHGHGVPVDHKLALKWFKKAAEQSHAEAQFNLGAMYFAGLGVDKKYSTALQYFSLAGDHGHTRALFNMAQMHLNGLGTTASCALGVSLHKAVAERGSWASVCSEAHRNFLKGRYEQAWMLYARAAEEGSELAQANSAWMLEHGYGFSDVEAQLAAARESRVAGVAAAAGGADAAGATDEPTPSSNLRFIIAHRHWTMAAQQGHVDSLRMLGDYAFDGRVTGGMPDYPAALKFYTRAADLRNAQSMFNLGYMHEHGLGVPAPDFHLAKRFYDNCLEAEPNAVVPVKLALAKLYLHSYFTEWTTPHQQQPESPPKGDSGGAKLGPKVVAPLPGPLVWLHDQVAKTGLLRWLDQVWHAESLFSMLLAVEDVVLALLCAALAIVVYLRSQR